jgi:glutathione S-transferase
MPLILHYHPLSSYCMKALVALYETGTPFTPRLVNLGDPAERAALLALWPIGKFPVLQDPDTDLVIPESTTIIEYLAQHSPGSTALIPADAERAREARLRDRFFDHYVHNAMQKITGDLLRPADQRDPLGVAQARAQVEVTYQMIEGQIGRAETTVRDPWAMGDSFTLADCAAAPALFYVSHYVPLERSDRGARKRPPGAPVMRCPRRRCALSRLSTPALDRHSAMARARTRHHREPRTRHHRLAPITAAHPCQGDCPAKVPAQLTTARRAPTSRSPPPGCRSGSP